MQQNVFVHLSHGSNVMTIDHVLILFNYKKLLRYVTYNACILLFKNRFYMC